MSENGKMVNSKLMAITLAALLLFQMFGGIQQ
jgi:hypothetical protein